MNCIANRRASTCWYMILHSIIIFMFAARGCPFYYHSSSLHCPLQIHLDLHSTTPLHSNHWTYANIFLSLQLYYIYSNKITMQFKYSAWANRSKAWYIVVLYIHISNSPLNKQTNTINVLLQCPVRGICMCALCSFVNVCGRCEYIER